MHTNFLPFSPDLLLIALLGTLIGISYFFTILGMSAIMRANSSTTVFVASWITVLVGATTIGVAFVAVASSGREETAEALARRLQIFQMRSLIRQSKQAHLFKVRLLHPSQDLKFRGYWFR